MHKDASMARCDKTLTRDRDKKAHSDLNYVWTSMSHEPENVAKNVINLSFTRSRRSKDVEIVGAEIQLISSVLVRFKCLKGDRLCRGRVSSLIAMCENTSLNLNSCLDEKDLIVSCMKLACFTIFVSSIIYKFRNDDLKHNH